MDQGPESKRPRLTTGSSWSSAGTSHHVSLPNPPPPTQAPHHPTPPGLYQPVPPYPRSSEPPPPPSAQHFDDRRHHEQEPFPPMQEHRQLPPSPAHPPYTQYTPREPMVKRDPAEVELPQLRRPHSTGNAQEPLPGTPHGPLPPQPHLDDRRHMSFDNSGPPPPPPPPPPGHLYRTPSYPPPTPLPQPQHYEHSMYGPPPGDPIYSIPFSTTAKRKAQRASQACDSCRSLKAKCDESKPCKNCREKGMECKYRDPIPKAQDKIAIDIMDGINALRAEVTTGFGRFESRMSKIERALRQINPSVDLDTDTTEPFRPFQDTVSPGPAAADDIYSSPGDIALATDTAPAVEPMVSLDEAQRTVREMQNDDEMDVEPGPLVLPGEPAMPINHTTFAGLLLTWQPIQDRVSHLLVAEGIRYPKEYPIRQEEQRGLLRLFGRGEGHDRKPTEGKDTPGDFGTVGGSHPVENQDDMSDIASPSPGDVWGQTGGLSPPAQVDILKGTPLRANGDLDFEPDRVWQYVASYEANIQNMHPLIIPKELHAMVQVFLDRVPSSKQSKTVAGMARFVGQTSSAPPEPVVEAGLKRKRSERSPAADVGDIAVMPQKPGKPYRNVDTALILLVLALGKICLWKDRKLPDVVPESDGVTHQSPQLRNGHPASPSQGSPPSHSAPSHSSGLPSPKIDERNVSSRRASFQGQYPTAKGPYTLKRNLDNIPGLEYFAIATDIIGNHIGGKDLKHVWVSILASLYYGQLGRPLQSLEHIAMAGRTLQSLLRPHFDRLGKIKQSFEPVSLKRDNQYVYAFWTCLQLESDILAELQLPPSGILAYEQQMPYPNDDLARGYGFSDYVLKGYTGQLFLRKLLNDIHKNLYDARREKKPTTEGEMESFRVFIDSLDPQKIMPEMYRFEESDPPAQDILAARIRAKYWGAGVITYRPFIREILFSNYNRKMPCDSSIPMPGDFRSDFAVPHIPPEARSSEDIDPQIIEYARRGIRALVESTRAFHGVPDKRFIVTNVFGTAHAQWGNLLILDAVHRDPILGRYLDRRTLRDLFRKTIEFFETVAQPSSSLTHDMNILKGLQRDLEHPRIDTDRATSSSLSSATTGPPPPLTPGAVPPSMQPPTTPSEAHFAPPPIHHLPFAADVRRPPGGER